METGGSHTHANNDMSTTIIEVNPDDAGPPTTSHLYRGQGLRGETQQGTHYRDASFAVAFLAQFGIIVLLAFTWGITSLKNQSIIEDDTTTTTEDGKPKYIPADDDVFDSTGNGSLLSGLLYLTIVTSFAGIGISAYTLELMTKYATQIIQISLFTSCCALSLMIIIILSHGGAEFVAFFWVFILILTGLYAYSVWNRIPFAAANLTTGLTAIQSNYGICLMGYATCFATYIWLMIWMVAFLGVGYKESKCYTVNDEGSTKCESDVNFVSFFLLGLSYFWTAQVLKVCMYVYHVHGRCTWWGGMYKYTFCLSILLSSMSVSQKMSFLVLLLNTVLRFSRNVVVLCRIYYIRQLQVLSVRGGLHHRKQIRFVVQLL